MTTIRLTILLIITLVCADLVSAVTIETVPIGNPGNPADMRYIDSEHRKGVGSVAYPFRIGKTEVTNAQYVQFLNAVAASDPHGLYNQRMGLYSQGGIDRFGSDSSYSYAVKSDAIGGGPGGANYSYANKPVVYVSWLDALRFVNWLHNGQGSGDTETGAYTMNEIGIGGIPIDGLRNSGARWWLPNEDEWYKAAYFDPTADVYYDYPTGTNNLPNNVVPSYNFSNSANYRYNFLIYTTGDESFPMTDAGAYGLSASPYGTFDQGGNVWEWNETLFSTYDAGIRGGSWIGDSTYLRASFSGRDSQGFFRTYEEADRGFRVVTIIPEPSTILLFGFGILLLGHRSRRENDGAREELACYNCRADTL